MHEAPVSKMALNSEHTLVFTGAEDGSLAIMAVMDRPKGSLRDVAHIPEVLIHGKLQRMHLEAIRHDEEELLMRTRD